MSPSLSVYGWGIRGVLGHDPPETFRVGTAIKCITNGYLVSTAELLQLNTAVYPSTSRGTEVRAMPSLLYKLQCAKYITQMRRL